MLLHYTVCMEFAKDMAAHYETLGIRKVRQLMGGVHANMGIN